MQLKFRKEGKNELEIFDGLALELESMFCRVIFVVRYSIKKGLQAEFYGTIEMLNMSIKATKFQIQNLF